MANTNITPPRAWTAKLRTETTKPRDPFDSTSAIELDPIERDAIDSAVPFAAEHARRYIATAGKDDGWDGPRPILLLYTTGRRSGDIRRNPLLYLEHEGARYIVGSKGGYATHPLWFLNLVAEPNVHIRVDADFYAAIAEVLEPDERARLWPTLTARYPMFADYQAHTERAIPLVRLRRT
ncbi:MAG TPA: nitroreductase/quinone reductase family protein [Pseudomonadales bacterium]|nr:nitroreductase/quinone reductase family protein [Pseudomonadales bacterium]